MADNTYFADATADEAELHRLRELERQLDPMSKQAFEALGICEGRNILEVGPGAGSMLTWVASRVGSDGYVTGLDLNPRFLGNLTEQNITVCKGNFLEDSVPGGPFDTIFARLVLMHIADAATAVKRMVELLRPGGSLLLVELDFASFRATNAEHPRASEIDRLVKLYTKVLREKKIMEFEFARALPALMENAGCIDVSATGTVWVEQGATSNAAFWKTGGQIGHAVVKSVAPEVTDLPDAEILEVYDDPSFRFMSPIYMVATGRKPDAE